jgi:hypothetical protein
VFLIYSYVPETQQTEMPQLVRDLNQRFQHLPLSVCCDTSRHSTRCCSCGHWRNSHNRVPLAVHINYTGSPISLSDHALRDKQGQFVDPGFHSLSDDSEEFPKPHEFSEVHL